MLEILMLMMNLNYRKMPQAANRMICIGLFLTKEVDCNISKKKCKIHPFLVNAYCSKRHEIMIDVKKFVNAYCSKSHEIMIGVKNEEKLRFWKFRIVIL